MGGSDSATAWSVTLPTRGSRSGCVHVSMKGPATCWKRSAPTSMPTRPPWSCTSRGPVMRFGPGGMHSGRESWQAVVRNADAADHFETALEVSRRLPEVTDADRAGLWTLVGERASWPACSTNRSMPTNAPLGSSGGPHRHRRPPRATGNRSQPNRPVRHSTGWWAGPGASWPTAGRRGDRQDLRGRSLRDEVCRSAGPGARAALLVGAERLEQPQERRKGCALHHGVGEALRVTGHVDECFGHPSPIVRRRRRQQQLDQPVALDGQQGGQLPRTRTTARRSSRSTG